MNAPSTLPHGNIQLLGKAALTKWTAPAPVTKRLSLATDGSIQKSSTAASLYEGDIARLEVTPKQFVATLKSVGFNDCLSYGIPGNPDAVAVTTLSKFIEAGKPKHLMPRTAEAMTWSDGTGILMIDYDPDGVPLIPNELLSALYICCPPLEHAAHVWAASTSSCIFDDKGKELRGTGGQRVYPFVADASDIERAGAVLAKRAWLKGYGHIKVSKSGQLLVRGLIDTAVFQTNRIDYCAPAICEPPLVQKKPSPKLYGNAKLALDTRVALPDLTPEEEAEYERLVCLAKAAKQSEAEAIRSVYIQERAADLVSRGVSKEDALKTVVRSLENKVLGPDFILTTEDGAQVTVGQLLQNRRLWDGHRFADPLEPDYHDDQRIARAYLQGPGRPRIYSFAHGGCSYELTEKTVTIQQISGNRHAYLCAIAEELQRRGEIYQRAGRMVIIRDDGNFDVQSDVSILTLFDRCFRFESWNEKKKGWQPSDPALQLAKQFLGSFVQSFPVVKAVITAPILDPVSNSVLATNGYDATTGLYTILPYDVEPIQDQLDLDDVVNAIATLWEPVAQFPFVDSIDQTVMFTAMLTAVERPVLPTAPAFAFDAPVQGSGKSLLCKVLAELSGVAPVMSPHPGAENESEMRKSLFAKLLGGSRVIVFDNVIGDVDSGVLAAVLTSSTFGDRVLQTSTSPVVPTNVLILLSGNNITLKGDLPRRVLKCRIDPKVETPHQRSFRFDPAQMTRKNRQRMVAAAMTLMVAYRQRGDGVHHGNGRMASFEDWDDLIRQTVCWLANLQQQGAVPTGVTGGGIAVPVLTDPFEAIAEATSEDPEVMQLGYLLEAWAAVIGSGHTASTMVTVKDLIKLHASNRATTAAASASGMLLSEILEDIAGMPRTFELNSRKLGNYLATHVDRWANGRALKKGGSYQGSTLWFVEERNPVANPAPVTTVVTAQPTTRGTRSTKKRTQGAQAHMPTRTPGPARASGGFGGFRGSISKISKGENENDETSVGIRKKRPTKPTKPTARKRPGTDGVASGA